MSILTIIPCRLKSTRFPNKGLSLIHGVSCIERCVLNAKSTKGVDQVVVGTSTQPEDDALMEFDRVGRFKVLRGSEDDVLERFIPYIDEMRPDHVIRATGDCPLVSAELAEFLINEHIKSGADLTYTNSKIALGCACEIYTSSAIRRLRSLSPKTAHSEYLIYYFTNNTKYFKINAVAAPEKFIKDWRLTFDETGDLILLEAIFKELEAERRAVSFDEVIDYFKKYPEMVRTNQGTFVKYRDDQDLVRQLKIATTLP